MTLLWCWRRDWWDGGAYRNCKLASVLLTGELQRRWGENGVVRFCMSTFKFARLPFELPDP